MSLVPPTTQATPTQPLSFTSLMQLPGYPYMTMSSLLQQQQQQPGERTRHNGKMLCLNIIINLYSLTWLLTDPVTLHNHTSPF